MGTVIGSLIIAVLTTGLVMLNVEAFWQFIVVGVVVIVAVLIDQSRDLIIGRDSGSAADMSEPVLSVRNLDKRFGGLIAVNERELGRLSAARWWRSSATTAPASRR